MHLPLEVAYWGQISATERDSRDLIFRFLQDRLTRTDLFDVLNDELIRRCRKSDPELKTTESEIAFRDMLAELYFSEAVEILIRNRNLLPTDVETEVSKLKPNLAFLADMRNSLAHQWPLRLEESDRLETIFEEMDSGNWPELRNFRNTLSEGSVIESQVKIPSLSSGVLNNLPKTEHGETGLIGRAETQAKIVQLLETERVVTIVGEGGIGKTSLALQIGYEFVRDPSKPFESVHWMSLKTESLTVDGIRQISGANNTFSEGLSDLAAPIESGFRGALVDLAQVLEGTRALICIDNLETASGAEFLELYDQLPKTVTYLVTSRRGIGQLERRVPIEPLAKKDALHLLNRMIRSRQVPSLKGLSEAARLSIVETFKANPLAIKWFVLSCEAGKSVQQIREHRADFLDYCIKSVITSVSNPAKEILGILAVANRSVALDALIAMTKLVPDVVFTAVTELVQSALVTTTMVSFEPPSEELEISPSVSEYIQLANFFAADELEAIETLLDSVDKDESKRQLELETRMLSPWAIEVQTGSQTSIANMLRQAMRASSSKDPDKALQLVTSARKMDETYFEVDKVEAWIRSFSDSHEASVRLYQSSINKCSNPEQAARVKYLLGGLEARAGRIGEAIKHAREVHSTIESPETSNQLGYFLVTSGQFQEGVSYLDLAFRNSGVESQNIFGPAYIRGLTRWGSHISESVGNPIEAFGKFSLAYAVYRESQTKGFRAQAWDEAYTSLLYSSSLALRACKLRAPDLYQQVVSAYIEILEFYRRAQSDQKYGERVNAILDWICGVDSEVDAYLLTAGRTTSAVLSEGEMYGQIINIKESYGFIQTSKFAQNVFFPGTALGGSVRVSDLRVGTRVSFTVVGESDFETPKPKASKVDVLEF